MSILIFIGLIILVLVLRASLRSNAEKSGLDICPKCNRKMELGATGRYHCTYCGYKQETKYF